MPDSDGWHDPFLNDGRMWRWHYCVGTAKDTLVPDTVEERDKHLRDCLARRDAAAKKLRKEADARRREALEQSRRERDVQ